MLNGSRSRSVFQIPDRLARYWSALKINAKLGISFGLFLILLLTEIFVSYAALEIVWEANRDILVSSNIQRIVMDMMRNWETARQLRQNFFMQSPIIGTDQAYKLYGLAAGNKIDEVIHGASVLQQLLESSDQSSFFFKRDAQVKAYLAEVSQYTEIFEEAANLELKLGTQNDGLRSRLLKQAAALKTALQAAPRSEDLLVEYYQLRLYETEYLHTQRVFQFTVIDEAASDLARSIQNHALDSATQTQALTALADYARSADEIIQTNTQIQEKLKTLDIEDHTIQPLLIEFRASANDEFFRAQQEIDQTRRTTIFMLVITLVAATTTTLVIANLLHRSITHNVLRLQIAANQLQMGNLDERVALHTTDELGQLGMAMNDMAAELGQTIRRLEIVLGASVGFSSEFDIQKIIARALQTAVGLSGAQAGLIGIMEGGRLSLAQAIGLADPDRLPAGQSLDKGLLARAVQRRQTEVALEAALEAEEVLLLADSRARAAIPLVSAQQLIGVLYLEARQPESFSSQTIRFLLLSATSAAAAIHTARLFAEAQHLALLDPLTGLYNRRGFLMFGKHEINRMRRFHSMISLLFIDIDHFKLFNDQYGYEVGDQVLQASAHCLQMHARSIDALCRYGGEEFILLLPEVDNPDAVAVAERVRSSIAGNQVDTRHGPLTVTVSIGVRSLTSLADLPPEVSQDDESVLNELIYEAGHMLHIAKSRGRNCVAA